MLVNHVKTVIGRNLESLDKRLMDAVRNGADVFPGFALQQRNPDERHNRLLG
jgi:hypothetical protein